MQTLWSPAPCKRAYRISVFHRSLKETFGNGYQQGLCRLKIPAIVYKRLTWSSRKPRALWVGCERMGRQKPPCKGCFHPSVIGADQHSPPVRCLLFGFLLPLTERQSCSRGRVTSVLSSGILAPIGNQISVPHPPCSLLDLVHKEVKAR